MSLKKTLFFLCCLLQFTHIAADNDVYFSKIGMEDGLSQLSVISIYQDELGRIWFGTREGVNIYDGNKVETLLPIANDTTSLSGGLIYNICGNQQGTVYIHTQKGVDAYDLRTNIVTHILSHRIDAFTYAADKLWIVENKHIYYFANGEKQLYASVQQSDSPIKQLFQSKDGKIYAGTLSSGVFVIDRNKNITQIIDIKSQVSSIYEDSKGTIWVGTWNHGLYKIDKNNKITNYRKEKSENEGLSSNFVRAIVEDNMGALWIGTKEGLHKLNSETNIFKHYGSTNNYKQLSNESIWALYKDNQGTIWIGSYFGGVNYFNPNIDFYTFHNFQQGELRNKPFPVISNIIEDKNQNLFLCTEGNGLIHYDVKTKHYRVFQHDANNPRSLTSNNIKTAYLNAEADELWLGLHLGGICLMDLKTGRITPFNKIAPNREQSNIVRAILPYNDKLLVATYNGLFLFDKKSRQFQLFSEKLDSELRYFVDVKIDNENNLWIAGNGLFRYDLHTKTLHRYRHNAADSTSISNDEVVKILYDSRKRIWFATNGGGINLYDKKTDGFIRFDNTNTRLRNNYISNLMEAPSGNLIIATTQNFALLNVENNKIYNYGFENGLPLNSLYNGGMCATRSGEIYIAGMNGMVSFYEKQLEIPQLPFELNLVNLWVNNKLVTPNDKTGILKQTLPFTSAIKLRHNHSMIRVEFASNNYILVNQSIFRYKLSGFSNTWITLPQGTNELNFMNLNPGKYKLMIEALSFTDGHVIASTALDIRMSPPIYNTWYAYLFYLFLIGFAVWRYIAFIESKMLLKTSLEYEKKEKEHIEAVNQSKLRFFTNISHEFRTPLTLIKAQVDLLLQTQNIPPSVFNKIQSIRRNTVNMQNLINELLEFRKSEQGFLTIKVQEMNLVSFLHEIYLSFEEYAGYRNIRFTFDCAEEEISLWFDPLQMQKVFYNLISNAFKYTQKGGEIDIVVTDNKDNVSVTIIDSGVGIEADALKKIFDRFYQVENETAVDKISPGTGIGLALTKHIVEKHAGTIHVTSSPKKGSAFTVTLKKGTAHYRGTQLCNFQENIDTETIENIEIPDAEFIKEFVTTDGDDAHHTHEYTMLIVEDNDELRALLQKIFGAIYKIHTAVDGEEGLKKTIELQPHIVLSDVMMPRMSGSEMCRRIKNDFTVCHIPVVLLTAQTAVEYSIEGLRLGADDYITKPFNTKALITRCNNLVNGRKLLQEKFSNSVDFKPEMVATNDFDRDFLNKAHQVIEKHLDNVDFNVTVFSNEMAFSRTKLFNKIKGITGKTPNEFILNIKMKKASELLTHKAEYNISDITYMLGFGSPKYFSKCFKEQFGVSPSAYRKQMQKGENEQ